MTEEEVVNIIKSVPSKSCERYVIPTLLLKPTLSKLGAVNLSSSTGIFANLWKSAIVRQLIKKQGLELIAKQITPMSNLSFMSMVVEKSVLQQFTAHCDANKLLPTNQHIEPSLVVKQL